jgi:hypothetical protein
MLRQSFAMVINIITRITPPIHKSQVVNEWFQQNLTPYQRTPAPPNSPEFYPISHAWSQAKVKVPNGGIYDSTDDLWLGISEAWVNTQENNEYLTYNLVNSMPQRLQSAIRCLWVIY